MKRLAMLATAAAVVGTAVIASGGFAESRKVSNSGTVITPGKGLILDIGQQRAIGYFMQANEECQLTIVISDAREEVAGSNAPGTRFVSIVRPGTAARIEVADGKSAEFSCSDDAQKMEARTYDLGAYLSPRS